MQNGALRVQGVCKRAPIPLMCAHLEFTTRTDVSMSAHTQVWDPRCTPKHLCLPTYERLYLHDFIHVSCACMHVYPCVNLHACTQYCCPLAFTDVCMYTHTHTRTHEHVYIHTYICLYKSTYVSENKTKICEGRTGLENTRRFSTANIYNSKKSFQTAQLTQCTRVHARVCVYCACTSMLLSFPHWRTQTRSLKAPHAHAHYHTHTTHAHIHHHAVIVLRHDNKTK